MIEKNYCPICGRHHGVQKETSKAVLNIKGVDIEYDELYFVCKYIDGEDNTYTTGKMEDQNLLNARNAYRRTTGLLTSDEIIRIRKNYDLSQSDFALLLGWGEVTISRYETKAIQDQAHDNLLRIVKDDPQVAYRLLLRNKQKFEGDRYKVIKEKVHRVLDEFGSKYIVRQGLTLDYLSYDEGSIYNGFEILNMDRLEEIIGYYAQRIQNLNPSKMMRLLWIADALRYKENGKAMSGLVYIRSKEYISPVGEKKIIQLQNYDANTFSNHPVAFLEELDIQVLDTVIECFGKMTFMQLQDAVCDEKTIQNMPIGNVIDFESAKTMKILKKLMKVSPQSVDTANLI